MNLEQQRAQMRAGQWYNDLTDELVHARQNTVRRTDEYNASFGQSPLERENLLAGLVESSGRNVHFEPTLRCEFGFHITIGNDFYANFDCVMLDGGGITIGDHVLLGPRVSIYTTNHALDPADRAAGWCIARSVTIEDHVWVGGDVTINPGVTIGAGSVIGSGSVVTNTIPAGVIAAGVPARVMRPITAADSLPPHP